MLHHLSPPSRALFVVLLTLFSCSGKGVIEAVDTSADGDVPDSRTSLDSHVDLATDIRVLPDGQPQETVPLDNAPQELHDSRLLMGNCCHFDTQCESGQLCLGAGDAAQGRCLPDPGGNECFVDSQCDEFEVCEGGIRVPACELAPDWEFHVGTCVLMQPPACCKTDGECGGGLACIGGQLGAGGVCLPAPEGDGCYRNDQCPAQHFCAGATQCSCDMNCISEPGRCAPLQASCCQAQGDCDEGFFCVPTGEIGVCEPLPPFAGKCWSHEQCAAGETCLGGWACPCNADCDGVDTYGQCQALPSGCCDTDADCAPDQLCKAVIPGYGLPGRCKANLSMLIGCPNPEGCCWDDSDCAPDKTCTGASVCGCIELCPQCGQCQEDVSGFCS